MNCTASRLYNIVDLDLHSLIDIGAVPHLIDVETCQLFVPGIQFDDLSRPLDQLQMHVPFVVNLGKQVNLIELLQNSILQFLRRVVPQVGLDFLVDESDSVNSLLQVIGDQKCRAQVDFQRGSEFFVFFLHVIALQKGLVGIC